jgi:hypothetical protein
MAAAKRRASCRELFKEQILALITIICSRQHGKHVELIRISAVLVQDTDITMFQMLTSVNIKKEFTIPELSYSINFHLKSKV